ncbi:MAG: hypothetical protein ACI9G1_001829 [Pirellulaceae bacterium]|jgi:hypothetical protein
MVSDNDSDADFENADIDEHDWVPNPPTESEVVFRTVSLAALLWRTQFEMHLQGDPGSREAVRTQFNELNEWMEKEGIAEHYSKVETELFGRPLGEWKEADVFQNIWRFEALAGIAWSIQQIDPMPSYLELVDGRRILESASLMGSVERLQKKAALRSADEINKQQETAEFWHWRTRTHMLMLDGVTPPEGDSFPEVISRVVEHAHSNGIVSEVIDGDVSVNGVAYQTLSRDDWSTIASISIERHLAFNWLAGHAPEKDWDQTPTDT